MNESDFQFNTLRDGHSVFPDHADHYVKVPETAADIDFGKIPPEVAGATGMLPIPIRLRNGWQRGNSGYGIKHILQRHRTEMARMDYWSVQDFVREVALYFDAVYRSHTGSWMLVLRADKSLNRDRALVVTLAP